MGLKAGSSAGEYMSREDWLELGEGKDVVAVKLKGWTKTTVKKGKDAGKELETAQIDVYVLSGKRKGEVILGEQVFGKGLVAPLRRESVGEELCYQVNVGMNGATEYAQFETPSDEALEAGIKVYDAILSGEDVEPEKPKAKTNGAAKKARKAKPAPEPVVEADEDEDDDEDDVEF